MNRGTILFRVDGSPQHGMGRLARCLALANALQRRRYQMTFIGNIDGNAWPDRIRRFRHAVTRTPHAAGSPEDRKAFLQEIALRNPLVVVVDAADLDEGYLAELSACVPVVIAMEDSAERSLPVDLVLNPTLGRGLSDFKVRAGGQVVFGNRFAMIRAEFRRARNIRATEPSGGPRVMVALGGGDNGEQSHAIAKALLQKKKIERIDVALGVEGKSKKQFEALVAASAGRLTTTCDVRDMGVRMTKSHLLVTAGGNTSLEGACVGMPMLLVSREARQDLNASQLDEIGAAQFLGRQGAVSPADVAEAAVNVLEDTFERKAMSRSGRLLIDGRGGDRIVIAVEILLRRSKRVKALSMAA
jgi:UDP-2,4-diacetamido-2,4,6-trideoxy-beta-L-altropyranose hydrolase